MKKKVEVFLVQGWQLIIQNRCCYLGQYYAEDDWTIEIIAEDLDTLQKLAAEKIVRTVIDGKSLYEVIYLEYEGNKFVVEQVECYQEKTQKVFENIVASEYYKKLLKLRKEEDKEKKIEEQKQLEKKRIEQEKKQYEKLRKKV